MRILSGIQPSGSIHIGNYFGMMRPMMAYQKRGELFPFIANLHSLTSVFEGKAVAEGTLNAATDYLALGLDSDKSTFWVQSDVPEVTELTWYLSNVTSVGLLQRSHAYKDKVDKGIAASSGLFTYPVLMASDILAYHPNIVPVGKDQKQHVEMARDMAIRFNNTYGDIFTIPEPEIQKDVAVVPGIDGKKMSKSYDNAIDIFGNEKAIRKRIMKIVTDSTPVNEPKNPDQCNVFSLYKLFADSDETNALAEKYRAGGFGYGDAKKMLADKMIGYFDPFRERHQQLLSKPDDVRDILKIGAKKAAAIAGETLDKVRTAVGVKY